MVLARGSLLSGALGLACLVSVTGIGGIRPLPVLLLERGGGIGEPGRGLRSDSAELGGCLAGEALGIPHVSVQSTGSAQAREAEGGGTARALDAHRAALGTQFHLVPGRVEALLAALAGVDCLAIVAVGRGKDVAAFGPQPDHVRVLDVVAQPLVLQCCDVFLSHGGFNSVRESLRAGVPLVVTPVTADQPANARRCAELGVARSFSEEPPPPAALAAACRDVLEDPGYRARARAMQRRIVALPSLDRLAADVERLVAAEAAR